ncbi:hypothetical protein BsWGS_23469 [Bradybaena similaris]
MSVFSAPTPTERGSVETVLGDATGLRLMPTAMSVPPIPVATRHGPPDGSNQRRVQIFTVKDPESADGATGKSTYDHVIQGEQEKDMHVYSGVEPLSPKSNDTQSRLETLEKQQQRFQQDFHQFKNDITSEIFSLKEINTRLMTLVTDSCQKLQGSMDSLLLKFMENSDHLGQQILEVRRDIAKSANRQQSSSGNLPASPSHVHSFEWEVRNVDSLLKNQKEYSSHCYQIPHIDYKTHGSVICHKDGRMRLKMAGEFGQNCSRNSLQRKTKFECTAHVVDKSEKLPEMLVGRVVGDFNIGNEWFLGEFWASEAKKLGYVSKGGYFSLKYTIETTG